MSKPLPPSPPPGALQEARDSIEYLGYQLDDLSPIASRAPSGSSEYPKPLRRYSTKKPLLDHNRKGSKVYSQIESSPADYDSADPSPAYTPSYASNSRGANSFNGFFQRLRRKPSSNPYDGGRPLDAHFVRQSRGLWKEQMLVDRSLQGMALLTLAIALALWIVVWVNAKAFQDRANKNSTSIGGGTGSCDTVSHNIKALLFIINVAGTAVLGMSNTYQQLVTSLRVGEVKWTLQKFGDCRVGTNSPFQINHKRDGRLKAWAAWLLLISTSLPVHFLLNSLVGPSLVVEAPMNIVYNATAAGNSTSQSSGIYPYSGYSGHVTVNDQNAFMCWSAFRTGVARMSHDIEEMSEFVGWTIGSDSYSGGYSNAGYKRTFGGILVTYNQKLCEKFRNTTQDPTAVEQEHVAEVYNRRYPFRYGVDNCTMYSQVGCELLEAQTPQCRMNVRMLPAFILAGCLTLKALYMICVNLIARGKTKTQVLTFGDAIVASALDPELRIENECMVNATEAYRTQVSHHCHKHCKDKVPSATGDGIGHCQKCTKFNDINRAANHVQPAIATKYKKSLISNLGHTALTQMLILMFCTFAMLGASIAVAALVSDTVDQTQRDCRLPNNRDDPECQKSGAQLFSEYSGGWGGFNTSASIAPLKPDSLSSELISICISNGAQFIYSVLYLLLIYNVTLISQEYEWGRLETGRRKLRCTLVKGEAFHQDYLLQLRKRVLFPLMGLSVLMHWFLGESIQTREYTWTDPGTGSWQSVEHSMYEVAYSAYPLFFSTILMLIMTSGCWWAFTYRREGYIPQMFGSIRVLCASTRELDDFYPGGVQWGDLGEGKQFRHAGLTSGEVQTIHPNELYAGRDAIEAAPDQVQGEVRDGDRKGKVKDD